MSHNFDYIRSEILEAIYDAENSKNNLPLTKMGVKGIDIFSFLKSELSKEEFEMQLSYLEETSSIRREKIDAVNSGSIDDKLRLSFYKITASGMNIVEGKSDSNYVGTQSLLGGYNNIGSLNIGIANGPGSHATGLKSTTYANTSGGSVVGTQVTTDVGNKINKYFEELETSIEKEVEPTSGEHAKTAKRDLNNIRVELEIEPKNNSIIEQLFVRLKKTLEPYKESFNLLGSLASILGYFKVF